MIAFSPSLPDITKSEPIRTFLVGQYLALLLEKPKLLVEDGPDCLTYLYAMVVGPVSEPGEIVMIVTSELTGTVIRKMMKETMGIDQTDPFLCIFDESGHRNFGYSASWANQEQFVTRALELVCERFKVSDAPTEIEPSKTPVSSDSSVSDRGIGSFFWWLIIAIVLGVVLFPPYTENFMANSGHGGWKFLFDIGENNTRYRSESISVGLWLLEFLLVGVGGILWWFKKKRP